ncbi:unnamed protein product [Schistosoma margrebowiei]|uniref:Tetratricopeptide repeat protein 21A/21B C-terminal ARM domain-containing protein n=1 Tax=Schistosoma margrebowiei TaxID=48269 RepID=A0A3P8EUC0_9TREM|nr:unnamed protein product [Schistosoma margrebowiei]
MVEMYIQSGKLEVCQELLKKCLKYNKSCIKAYEYFGLIMEKEQNFFEAVKYYEYIWNNLNHQNPDDDDNDDDNHDDDDDDGNDNEKAILSYDFYYYTIDVQVLDNLYELSKLCNIIH